MEDSALDRAREALRSVGRRLAGAFVRLRPGADGDGGTDSDPDAAPPDHAGGPGALLRPAEEAEHIVVFAEDDPFDVIELLAHAETDDVVLLVPHGATALREPLAWPHIAAQVRRRDVRVLVVSERRDVRQAARAAGFDVASRLRTGGRTVRIGERLFTLPDLDFGRWARAGALAALPLVGLAIAWCTVPAAEVLIVPQSTPVRGSAEVRINPIVDEPDAATGVLPARSLRRTMTTVASTTTTGTAEVGDVAATISLSFTNDGPAAISLPAGFEVSDENGVAFALDAALVVPPGETAEAAATATRPGLGGNVEAGSVRLLPDDQPPTLTVVNADAATGGTDREVAAVDVGDIDRVRLIAEDVLRVVAERELRAAAAPDDAFLEETISVAILGERPLANPGDVGDVFLMEYEAVVSVLVVRAADLVTFAEQALAPDVAEGAVLLTETIRTDLPAAARRSVNGVLTGVVEMEGRVAPPIDTGAIRSAITGASPGEAQRRVAELAALEAPPRVEITPGWWPDWRLPERSGRITVTLVGSLPEPASAEADEADGS